MDEETVFKLDEEFKRSLKYIRPYIVNLTNQDYIIPCRLWFEKMNHCSGAEKALRNDYFNELCRQIKNGKLEPPFTYAPPDGPLVDPSDTGPQCSSTSWSDMTSNDNESTLEIAASGDAETGHQNQHNKNHSDMNAYYANLYESKFNEQNVIIQDLQNQNDHLKDLLNQSTTRFNTRHTEAEMGVNLLHQEVDYLKGRLKELVVMKRTLQDSHNSIVLRWSNAVQNLQVKLAEERNQRNELQTQFNELSQKVESQFNAQSGDQFCEKQNLVKTYESKIRLLNIEHCENVKYLEDKYLNKIKEIEEKFALDKDSIYKEHELELNTIRHEHFEHVQTHENLYSDQLKEYENDCAERIKKLVEEFEYKMNTVNTEYKETIETKDKEIIRLEKLVANQCDRMHQEVVYIKSQMEQDVPSQTGKEALINKISFLQKCILKMEKLLRRYEKHYTKKIAVLRRELQLKDNAVQMELTTQRAQLLARASTERQQEIEDVVLQLEKRYRILLEDQQQQANRLRHLDQSKITELTNKLDSAT